MLLALTVLTVQKHGLRPTCIRPVPPHEGRVQLRCPVHRGVIEKQPLRGMQVAGSLIFRAQVGPKPIPRSGVLTVCMYPASIG